MKSVILLLAALCLLPAAGILCYAGPAAGEGAKRTPVTTAIPVMETVCVEPAEGYCMRYETRRLLIE